MECRRMAQWAKKILEDGVDEHGIYYSVYTWAALTYFVADLWR